MSDRAATATATRTPKAMYLVAVVFFFEALICLTAIFGFIPRLFRRSPAATATTVAVIVCVACYGVYLLVRQYRVANWLMYAMTVYLAVLLLTGSAEGSPFYSSARIYVNRIALLLPLVASCIYLARRR